MQRFKCRLGIHDWYKWEVTDSGRLYTENNNYVGDFIIQQRHCKCCGFRKIKRVDTK